MTTWLSGIAVSSILASWVEFQRSIISLPGSAALSRTHIDRVWASVGAAARSVADRTGTPIVKALESFIYFLPVAMVSAMVHCCTNARKSFS